MRSAVTEDLSEARRLFEGGEPGKAAQLVSTWLESHPDDAQAYHLLGACYAAMGYAAGAATSLGRAVGLDPADGHHRVAFAIAVGVFGDMARAREEYAAGREGCGAAFGAFEFGLLCLCRQSAREAERHFTEVLDADPADVWARLGLALAWAQDGQVARARASFAELAAADTAAHLAPGVLCARLERENRKEDTLEILRLAQLVEAEDPDLPYRLAAAEGIALSRAPEGYVASYFDRFAPTFDDHLSELKYRTPELLVDACTRYLAGRTDLSVLDGGCGTGLCGPLLRPMAGRLVGVDLSTAMLDKARSRGVYDQLEQGDLEHALGERPGQLDLIVCADVLVYLGDLRAFFRAAAGALRPGGVLGVSVERLESGGDYVLQHSGRFAHAPGYVRETAAPAGLELLEEAACDLRLERRDWVPGTITVHRISG